MHKHPWIHLQGDSWEYALFFSEFVVVCYFRLVPHMPLAQSLPAHFLPICQRCTHTHCAHIISYSKHTHTHTHTGGMHPFATTRQTHTHTHCGQHQRESVMSAALSANMLISFPAETPHPAATHTGRSTQQQHNTTQHTHGWGCLHAHTETHNIYWLTKKHVHTHAHKHTNTQTHTCINSPAHPSFVHNMSTHREKHHIS